MEIKEIKKEALALFLITLFGVLLRYSYLVGYEYPVGWDSNAYISYNYIFIESFPGIPDTINFRGGIPSNKDILPGYHYLIALLYYILSIFFKDIDVVWITRYSPVILYIFINISIFFLGKKILKNGILPSFFYTTFFYEYYYTYAGHTMRNTFGILLILYLLWFFISYLEEDRINFKSLFLSSLFLGFIFISHDFTFFVILFVLFSLFIVVDKKNKLKILTMIVVFLLIFSLALYEYKDIYLERFEQSGESIGVKQFEHIVSSYRSINYGIVTGILLLCLSLISFIYISMSSKRNKEEIRYLPFYLLFIFTLLGYLNMTGIHILPRAFQRFFVFGAISYPILATLTFEKIKPYFTQKRYVLKAFVLFILLFQIYELSDAVEHGLEKGKFTAKKEFFDTISWIKNNTEENSIIVVTGQCPFPIGDLFGLSDRITIQTPYDVSPVGNKSAEGRLYLMAKEMVGLENPRNARDIIIDLSKKHNNTTIYIIAGKGCETRGRIKYSHEKLEKFYKKIYENEIIVVYKANNW